MPDWVAMFVPDQPLAESFLRGVIIYVALIVLFRTVLRRQGGSVGLPDVMLVVLISECVSNAMGAESKSIPNGLAAVVALLVTNFGLDWAAYRWKWIRRRLEPPPLPLIKDGEILREHLAQERLSDEELLAQLRLNGIDDPRKVRLAVMEAEGEISVVPCSQTEESSVLAPAEPNVNFDRQVDEFLRAAAALERTARMHEESAAEHLKSAKSIRQTLADNGICIPKRNRKQISPRPPSSEASAKSG